MSHGIATNVPVALRGSGFNHKTSKLDKTVLSVPPISVKGCHSFRWMGASFFGSNHAT